MGGRDVVRKIIPMARYTPHFEPLPPIISFPCPHSSSVSKLEPIKKISKFIKFNIKNIHPIGFGPFRGALVIVVVAHYTWTVIGLAK